MSDGSSPRGRGAQSRRGRIGEAGGLIPARAGSTAVSSSSGDQAGAHPRAGGEHTG